MGRRRGGERSNDHETPMGNQSTREMLLHTRTCPHTDVAGPCVHWTEATPQGLPRHSCVSMGTWPVLTPLSDEGAGVPRGSLHLSARPVSRFTQSPRETEPASVATDCAFLQAYLRLGNARGDLFCADRFSGTNSCKFSTICFLPTRTHLLSLQAKPHGWTEGNKPQTVRRRDPESALPPGARWAVQAGSHTRSTKGRV